MATSAPTRSLPAGHPVTPDGRYFVVRGRLWRMSDPRLAAETRQQLTSELMRARRAVRQALQARDAVALRGARAAVQEAKVSLGERGPPWWDDGTPDYNRRMVHATPYAQWHADGAAPG